MDHFEDAYLMVCNNMFINVIKRMSWTFISDGNFPSHNIFDIAYGWLTRLFCKLIYAFQDIQDKM